MKKKNLKIESVTIDLNEIKKGIDDKKSESKNSKLNDNTKEKNK